MARLRIETVIDAPIARCFDLARSVDAHVATAQRTGEVAVDGRTSGLCALDDTVTWQGRHLGVCQRLTSQITAMDRPAHFQDRMLRGAFKCFAHDHTFVRTDDGRTRMVDEVEFTAPWGWLGRLAERWVVGPHLRRFLVERAEALRTLAETDGWRRFIPDAVEG
ncbi:MAG: SRPBCC family protein [Planctomycetota bacterium]